MRGRPRVRLFGCLAVLLKPGCRVRAGALGDTSFSGGRVGIPLIHSMSRYPSSYRSDRKTAMKGEAGNFDLGKLHAAATVV